MEKDFLDELIEELNKLKDSEAERVYEAIEARKFPPIPLTPMTVMKTVHQVCMRHKVTGEELEQLMGMNISNAPTAAEAQLIREIAE